MKDENCKKIRDQNIFTQLKMKIKQSKLTNISKVIRLLTCDMPQVGLFVFSNIKKRAGFANIFSRRKQNSDNELRA